MCGKWYWLVFDMSKLYSLNLKLRLDVLGKSVWDDVEISLKSAYCSLASVSPQREGILFNGILELIFETDISMGKRLG